MSDPNDRAADGTESEHVEVVAAKRAVRAEMRARRRSLVHRPERSERIIGHVTALGPVREASTLLAYTAVRGEVETDSLVAWCRANDVELAMPEDPGLDAEWPDVIVVPGTAFTARGDRIGQGGGWYDRFLPGRRPDSVTVGIGFVEQLVDFLPLEPHDVQLDCVVTDDGPLWPDG